MSAQSRWERTDPAPRSVAVTVSGRQKGADHDAVRIVTLIAIASIAAGAINAAAAATIAQGSAENLAFFGVVAVAQIAWGAVALVRAPRWWLGLGTLGNAVVVATWAVSRTVGLPFGDLAGVILPVGFPDGLATILEAVTAVGAGWLAVRGWSPARSAVRARGFAFAAAIVIGALGLGGVMSQASASSSGGDGSGGRNVPTAPSGGGGYGGHYGY
jgi:hypothetical protein